MIKSLNLQGFRNFKKEDFTFSPKVTVISGVNASGKTNILEAINLLATGKSFKARMEGEMVGYTSQVARVIGKIENKEEVFKLEVVLTRGQIPISGKIQKTPKKRLLVQDLPKRLIDFAGRFKCVVFAPEDLDLVTHSPSLRRRFLDDVLSQTDREYRRSFISYEKGLRQRNKLLVKIRDEGVSVNQLLFWNKLLIKNGNYISEKRRELVEYVNQTEGLDNRKFSIVYDASSISEPRLEQYGKEEIAAATTLVGPHRDDIIFFIKGEKGNKRELARYGSRGEIRMGVLWVKLAELSYINDISKEKPTLLLDDIFSELDKEHRQVVVDMVSNQQTVITTADLEYIKTMQNLEKISLN